MKEAELPNLWDNPDMKLVSWCFGYQNRLSCLFWLWDLWYFSSADTSGCRGERGEQEALHGNCYGFVCIKVVSPRGSYQEYRQGVLSTWAHICPEAEQGAKRGAIRQEQISSPSLGLYFAYSDFWPYVIAKHVRPVLFSDTSHLVSRCSPLEVSMGDKRCGRNDSQCSSGSYLLILVSTQKVRIELVDLKVYVNYVCVSYPSGGMTVLQRC